MKAKARPTRSRYLTPRTSTKSWARVLEVSTYRAGRCRGVVEVVLVSGVHITDASGAVVCHGPLLEPYASGKCVSVN